MTYNPAKPLEVIIESEDEAVYIFTKKQKSKILEKWGFDFYRILHFSVKVLAEQWRLFDLEFCEFYSCNAIFFCKSELYGDCILKINKDGDEAVDDYNSLREYDGGHFIKAYEYEFGAVLVERAVPGEPLKNEPSLDKRLAAFSDLFNGRHIVPKKPELFDTFTNWITFLTDFVVYKHKDNEELCNYALKTNEIYSELALVYNKKLLIHLDLALNNIVSCGNGRYKIIDPYRTVIGDPIFETGRFIWDECFSHGWDNNFSHKNESEKAVIVLEYLEKSINIPKMILKKCYYLDVAMVLFENSQWSSDCKLDGIRYAENFMNTR